MCLHGQVPDAGKDRARALGSELIEVHDWLRQQLRRLRAALADGSTRPVAAAGSLRAHCLSFCAALASHHTSEDRRAFPALAAQLPGLTAVLAELERDHQLVAAILRRAEQIAAEAGEGSLAALRAELDGLAAILESHFRWEERRLVAALNELDQPGATAADLFGLPDR